MVKLCEQPLPLFIIHRTAIVRVYQAEVPQLGPLVNIRIAGSGNGEQPLGQGIDRAKERDCRHETLYLLEECIRAAAGAGAEDFFYEKLQRLNVSRIVIDPTQIHLGFMNGFGHVLLDPLNIVFARLLGIEIKRP